VLFSIVKNFFSLFRLVFAERTDDSARFKVERAGVCACRLIVPLRAVQKIAPLRAIQT
jgi:hypothetical protein